MGSQKATIRQVNHGPMAGPMQAIIGNDNRQEAHSFTGHNDMPPLTPQEIIQLLTEIKMTIQDSCLADPVKNRIDSRIESAIDESGRPDSERESVAIDLKRVIQTLKETNVGLDEGKKIIEKIKPTLIRMLSWLNVSDIFLGL